MEDMKLIGLYFMSNKKNPNYVKVALRVRHESFNATIFIIRKALSIVDIRKSKIVMH